MKTKVCIKCGRELPRNEEYFNKAIRSADGLKGACKQCLSEYDKQYRKKNATRLTKYHKDNLEHIAECTKQYRKNNPDKLAKYYKDNIEHIIERNKQYRKDNIELAKERDNKRYRDNSERLIKCAKQYRKDNVDKIAKHKKQYAKENMEQGRISGQRRLARKRQLPSTLTLVQWEQIRKRFNNCCAYCGKELPLAQEHFLALSKGGEYTVNNIIPSCKPCNSSKGNKDFFEWYSKHDYYSVKREKFILKFLNYKDGIQQLKII